MLDLLRSRSIISIRKRSTRSKDENPPKRPACMEAEQERIICQFERTVGVEKDKEMTCLIMECVFVTAKVRMQSAFVLLIIQVSTFPV